MEEEKCKYQQESSGWPHGKAMAEGTKEVRSRRSKGGTNGSTERYEATRNS